MSIDRLFHLQFGRDGGTERFFLRLAQAFHEEGITQEFAIRPGNGWRDQLAAFGSVQEGHFLRRTPTGLLQAARLGGQIRRFAPDAILAWRAPAARLIPNLPKAAKVLRLGDYPRHTRHFTHLDCIVGNTPPVLRHCRKIGWEGPLEIISNFPTQNPITPAARARFDTPEEVFLICGAGRFFRTKGMDTLIRAVALCPDAWLWLVGDGEDRPMLEALVDELGLRARTRFVGWVDRTTDYIAAADVFCVPSREEPLGNVLLEGWASGVPVVTTRSEGPDWAATDGKDALKTEIDDAAGIAQAIQRIADAPELAAQLVAEGRATLTREFSKDRIVSKYLTLFDAIRAGQL